MTSKFEMICNDSRSYNERNDCTVKALAIATGIDYLDAHTALKKQGRGDRQGCMKPQQEKALNSVGYSIERLARYKLTPSGRRCGVMKEYRGKTMTTVAKYLDPSKVYWIYTSGHVAAVVNGKVEDWTEGRRHRVLDVCEITRTA